MKQTEPKTTISFRLGEAEYAELKAYADAHRWSLASATQFLVQIGIQAERNEREEAVNNG